MRTVKKRESKTGGAGLFIGIDPGQSGGVAWIDQQGCAHARKMPVTDRDILDLLRELREGDYDGEPFACLERVASMPRQGVASTFKFGKNFGALGMALIAAGIPFELVTPGSWQRKLSCLTKGDKNVTKRKAQELFPAVPVTHAVADALLIAEYARRVRNGK